MKAKDILFEQVTSVEHWEDNDELFTSMFNAIKSGHAKNVVVEMKVWPKSNLDPIHYSTILKYASDNNEYVVYDDYNYLLAANENCIVLYQRLDNKIN